MSDDRWPYHCQAHPRPDRTLPADDVRRDMVAIALGICSLVLIWLFSGGLS